MKDKCAPSIIIAWLSFFCAPIALVIGHTGAHDLDWIRNQISSFAARAPHGNWITWSMLLTALGLFCIGIALSKCQTFVQGFVKQIMSMLIGISISGLLILAVYKETAMSLGQLKNMPFEAVRQQSFHDAGLLIFYYSSILFVVISGFGVMIQEKKWIDKVIGSVIAGTGPISFILMTLSWPQHLGFAGASFGIKQRAAFLCLWSGSLLLLTLLTKSLGKQNKGRSS